jgi:pimeloyl-ACP methyl ester carboxylesterase
MKAEIEPIVGRYMNHAIGGRDHRIYFEEAGEGIPLVCLHTAGSDGRQWRHILADPEITSKFRVITFDLPRHGKSNPPAGFEKEQQYRLGRQEYIDMISGFCDALELEKPVVMGCSIGGRIVLDLGLAHPDKFGALVGVQCSDYHRPWYDSTWMNRPDVHGGEICAAIVSGMMAPQSPTVSVQETLWYYKQSGPGVFKGDLYFYGAEGDIRDEVSRFDTEKCPLYILTGEYDYSCTPENSEQTVARIRGARMTRMQELGHFPMSENPVQFRKYIMPVLEEISRNQAR